MDAQELPKTPRELVRFRFVEGIMYKTVLFFVEKTRLWKRAVRANGDLEHMRFRDIVYWLYKTTNPIRSARAGSGLEGYFEGYDRKICSPPDDFTILEEITLSAAGDLIRHAYIGNSVDLYRDIEYAIFGADIPMANLECVIFDGDKEFEFTTDSGPSLWFSPREFDTVKGCGGKTFRFLSTACNHSLDFGMEGVEATIRHLEKNGISHNGVNKNDADYDKATILERKGFRIAIISHTFGLNAHAVPPSRPKIVNYTNLNDKVERVDFSLIQSQIKHARESGADFIIAQLHWGMEHEFYPTPEQVGVAHRLAELGIDAIIGHHPHVVQPYEYYRTKRDTDRLVPVFYSLGNLINPFSADYLCLGYVVNLTLAKGTKGNSRTPVVYVKSSACHTIRQSADHDAGMIVLKIETTS